MSQCFRLVNGGYVDKIIVFDSLPERLLKGIKTREVAGFPRSWARWLLDIGSTRTVFKTETSVDLARNWTYKHTPIGKEPCFFVLEYTDINADKDAWRHISEYIRTSVGPEVRLREKLEDMALAFAPKPTDALSIEPEDVPVIPVPKEKVQVAAPKEDDLVTREEPFIIQEKSEVVKKKPGRPRKAVPVEA